MTPTQDSKMTSKGIKRTQRDSQLEEHTSLTAPAGGEAMEVDQQYQEEQDDVGADNDDDSDTDSTISSSLPSSFLFKKPNLEQRRVSTPSTVLSTPMHTRNPLLNLDGERAAAMVPRRRVMKTPPPASDDEFISTPTKVYGSTAPLVKSSFTSRPGGSLLSKMTAGGVEKGSLLGKHPQTPSPGDETLRTKGFKSLSSKASISSPFGNDSDSNPFLGSAKPKARFEMDYLSESQWYSEYPHHLTEEYLEDLFRLDRRVMFLKGKAGSRLYPDYLTTNFYVNEIVLGAGEHADVLKVQSKNNKEFYAVKRLLRTVQGAMERKRYLNEVRNMWRIEKSPNVLQLLEAWEQKGKIYMRMELCKLGSLQSALLAQKKYGGFDEKRTWKCLTDLASGLRAIHDSNIIHLDIKPENIFITAAGALKIGDFGHSITYPVEKKDITEGDKFYMAQELLNGHCGKYSDVFSLGMTIYEMVTNQSGDLPGEGPQWHELRDGNFSLESITDRGRKLAENALDTPPNEPMTTGSLISTASSISASPMSFSASSVSAPFESVLGSSILKSGQQKLFSMDLIELVKEMMQPDYLVRPSASTVLSHPTIQRILNRRNDASSKGARTEEAMSGLLLQSV
ncbi:hypothetical protein BGX24_006061 [Mortierella sp. AD032]|nr:hypothetical protein BGX24_006061 [Mortierella sp. AD032]